ncbi:unnamed protein product [Urochloa humidicola]
MQGGNGYGYGGYGYGYVYDAGAYGSAGGYYYSNGYDDPAPAAPALPAAALDGGVVELQPSEACPRNYVIFDQTRAGTSSVTFHPTLARNLAGGDSFYGGGCSPARQEGEEDPEEIDALLQSSSEEEDDDDVASTGRTPGCGGSSPESSACSAAAAAGGGGGRPRKKKERIKRMMRALKGVVPGGSKMDTPAVLDEAVCYLRSLKLEAATKKKLGAHGGSDT